MPSSTCRFEETDFGRRRGLSQPTSGRDQALWKEEGSSSDASEPSPHLTTPLLNSFKVCQLVDRSLTHDGTATDDHRRFNHRLHPLPLSLPILPLDRLRSLHTNPSSSLTPRALTITPRLSSTNPLHLHCPTNPRPPHRRPLRSTPLHPPTNPLPPPPNQQRTNRLPRTPLPSSSRTICRTSSLSTGTLLSLSRLRGELVWCSRVGEDVDSGESDEALGRVGRGGVEGCTWWCGEEGGGS